MKTFVVVNFLRNQFLAICDLKQQTNDHRAVCKFT